MTRWLTIVSLAVVALLGSGFAAQSSDSPPQQAVCVVNASTHLTDSQVQNAIPAFQAAVDFDFGPIWNQRANIQFVPSGQTPPAGCWTITLMDTLDVAALGYHDTGPGDIPFAHVQADPDWTIILTHELFEMLADPRADRFAGAKSSYNITTTIYVLEVCDPVEADSLAYTRPGADGSPVQISDFVTERWYDGQGRGKIDFEGKLLRAHTLYPGGYMWVFKSGQWQQVTRDVRQVIE